MPRLILAILIALLWRDAIAAQYFVSKAGNDGSSGLSGSPVLTITKGVSLLSAGDSLTVSNGVYNEFVVVPSSGTSGSQITIQAIDTNTVIDPSTDFSAGWVAAPEIGPLVYKQTGMPFVTRYMSIDGSNIASVFTIGDVTAQVGNVFIGSGITNGTNCLNVPANATFLRDGVQCSYWDPLGGALFIADGTTAYLRLRDGSSPNGHTIKANKNSNGAYTFQPAFSASAVAMSGRSNIVFQGFQIRNAFTAFFVLNSSANTIQSNLIVGTFIREYVNGLGSSNNVFTGNTCIGNFYGNPGGAWEGSTSADAENKHGTYVWGKYMMGQSTTFDNPVTIYQAGSSNEVSYNTFSSGLGANGVTIWGDIAHPMYGTKVFGNFIEKQSSVGYLDNMGNTYSQVFSNSFSDCDISIRLHELNTVGETNRTNFIYRNTSYLPTGIGNHLFFFFNSSGGAYKPSHRIYFNSFSGGNVAAQWNQFAESSGGTPFTLIFNNIFSGANAYFTGPAGFSTDASAVGAFDYNLVTPPSAGSTAWFGAHNIKTNAVWPNLAGMNFVLPPDSSAIGSALDASGSFTLNGQTYSGFPDGATKLGAQWDMGALEKFPIWYVDIATPINGNGLSWATAWKDLTNIVWASVNPGDTILVSQGNYAALNPTKGGAIGTNIIITPSQSPGRNAGVTNAGFFTAVGNITLDGAEDYGYTNNIQNTVVVPQITNNIGWHIVTTNTPNTDGAGTCINISGNATNGIVLRWLELTQLSDHQEDYGVRFNYSAPYMQDNNEVGYCWIHHVGQDGVKNFGSTGVHMDQTLIHHCLIEKTGDDGCELNSGYSVVNCIIRDARDQILRGHPDGISGQTFSYSRFVNNIVWGFKRSECFYLNTFAQSNISIWSYGNLVYWGDTNTLEVSKTVGSYGMEDLYWAPQFGHVPGTSDTNIYWQDIRIFNNTFAAFPPYSVSPFDFFNRYRNGSDPNPLKWCTVWIIGGKMFNNVMYNGSGGAFGAANNIACDPTRLTIGWNNGFSTNTSGKSWQTEDGTWATGEAMDAANPGWYGDSSAQPTFVSPYPPQWDYRIAPTDSALTGKGTNLSAYVASMPGLDTDLYGVPRGTIWDVGASQHTGVDTNWIVWLRFTNDFSAGGGKLVDSTGTGHDFYRIGLTNNPFPTNFPVSVSGTNWTGGRTNQVAKFRESFIQNPDPRAAFEFGTWGALTNVDAFTNATQLSVTVWVATDTDRNNYSATVLDAGHAGLGCWSFGRYFSFPPTNNFMLTISTNYAGGGNWDRDLSMVWPNNQQVYGGQWHFYAFTFNNGQCSIYFDGTNCGGTTLIGVTALSLWPCANNEDTTQPCLRWLALGCRTHNGNPAIWNWANTTDYPNNGWFSGGIDDVRMFTECLTPAQVLDIFNQSNSGGGGGGGTSSSLARVTNLRVGKTFIGQ